MTASTGTIVVGVDGSPPSIAAVHWAARDAESRGAELRIVHAQPPPPAPIGLWPDTATLTETARWHDMAARPIVDEALEAAGSVTSAGFAEHISAEVIAVAVIPYLIEVSRTAQMVVTGCRGRGTVARVLLGSVSSSLARHASCPVVVVHDEIPYEKMDPAAPVVLGVDDSPTSERAIPFAFEEASLRHAPLVAVHAWTDMTALGVPSTNWSPAEWSNHKEAATTRLRAKLAPAREQFPDVEVREVVVADEPTPRLLDQAEVAQLVVLGSHGHGGFVGMLLGSTSRAVVNAARVPVAIIRMSPRRH